jgi:hypothetical protein
VLGDHLRPVAKGGVLSDAGHSLFEEISRRTQSAAGQLRVRSALNPMLWMCAIVTPSCFGAAYIFSGHPLQQSILLIAGIVPICVACSGFGYFAIYAPQRLQSEEYQIRHEAMELIRQKGSAIAVAPTSLDALTNPALLQLEQKGGGE